ncbi:MAG: response regulator [Bacteriovoracaceae bacterium]
MKTVFIIDDDKDIREVMTYVLESEGYKTHLFSDAMTAYENLVSCKDLPDAIILDYMMPGMNGVEFLNRISDLSQEIQEIPIAFSSRMGSVEGLQGNSNVTILSKPIDLEQLFNFLSNC